MSSCNSCWNVHNSEDNLSRVHFISFSTVVEVSGDTRHNLVTQKVRLFLPQRLSLLVFLCNFY